MILLVKWKYQASYENLPWLYFFCIFSSAFVNDLINPWEVEIMSMTRKTTINLLYNWCKKKTFSARFIISRDFILDHKTKYNNPLVGGCRRNGKEKDCSLNVKGCFQKIYIKHKFFKGKLWIEKWKMKVMFSWVIRLPFLVH